MERKIVESFLKEGFIDKEILEQAIRVGIRKSKKAKTDPVKRKKAREYYRKNRGKILKKAREYYRKNKKRIQAYMKAYRKKFGEATEQDWELLKDTATELLKIAEEIDSVMYIILSQIIDEIDNGDLTDKDYKEYKEILDEFIEALTEEEKNTEGEDDE